MTAPSRVSAVFVGVALAASALAGCGRSAQSALPVAARPATAPRLPATPGGERDAAAAADASVADAGPPDPRARSELLPSVLERCDAPAAAERPAGTPAPRLGPRGWRTDLLPPDQRAEEFELPDEAAGGDAGPNRLSIPTRVGAVRAPDGGEQLVTVGFGISGVDEADCSRVVAFDWGARERIYAGPIARIDGPPEAGTAYFLRTDGPYSGAGLLVVTDAQDEPRWVRYFDGPTVLRPTTLGVFAGGESFVVYLVADGMNFESPTVTALVALSAEGLVQVASVSAGISTEGACHSVGIGAMPEDGEPVTAVPRCRVAPAGGIRVLARGAAPRIALLQHEASEGTDDDPTPWYRRTESYERREYRYAPAERRFVAAGQPGAVRLRPRITRLPLAPAR